MSSESDCALDGQAMKAAKKERHAEWYAINRDVMYQNYSGRFKERDTVILFREAGKPAVDFYPHTGRWKVKGRMFRGGARSFYGWYEKQGGNNVLA